MQCIYVFSARALTLFGKKKSVEKLCDVTSFKLLGHHDKKMTQYLSH